MKLRGFIHALQPPTLRICFMNVELCTICFANDTNCDKPTNESTARVASGHRTDTTELKSCVAGAEAKNQTRGQ